MQALERLSRSEESALLDLVRANGLDESKLACYMTRQHGEGRGTHGHQGGFLDGRSFSISYDLMLCEYCGNLMPSVVITDAAPKDRIVMGRFPTWQEVLEHGSFEKAIEAQKREWAMITGIDVKE